MVDFKPFDQKSTLTSNIYKKIQFSSVQNLFLPWKDSRNVLNASGMKSQQEKVLQCSVIESVDYQL